MALLRMHHMKKLPKWEFFHMVHPAGIEPTSTVPKTGTLSIELRAQIKTVRAGVIETPTGPWQGPVIPLNHARVNIYHYSIKLKQFHNLIIVF